jgi:hypothetical protein
MASQVSKILPVRNQETLVILNEMVAGIRQEKHKYRGANKQMYTLFDYHSLSCAPYYLFIAATDFFV